MSEPWRIDEEGRIYYRGLFVAHIAADPDHISSATRFVVEQQIGVRLRLDRRKAAGAEPMWVAVTGDGRRIHLERQADGSLDTERIQGKTLASVLYVDPVTGEESPLGFVTAEGRPHMGPVVLGRNWVDQMQAGPGEGGDARSRLQAFEEALRQVDRKALKAALGTVLAERHGALCPDGEDEAERILAGLESLGYDVVLRPGPMAVATALVEERQEALARRVEVARRIEEGRARYSRLCEQTLRLDQAHAEAEALLGRLQEVLRTMELPGPMPGAPSITGEQIFERWLAAARAFVGHHRQWAEVEAARKRET